MNRHKGLWGRKSLMNQGEKEKLRISQRLKNYGTNLPFVDKALSFDGKQKDFPLSLMRQIQTNISHKYQLPTDRSAWRTKTGMKAWFCEYWDIIEEYVFQEINNIDLQKYYCENHSFKAEEQNSKIDFPFDTPLYTQNSHSNLVQCSTMGINSNHNQKSPEFAQNDTPYFLSIDYLLNDKKPIHSPLSA